MLTVPRFAYRVTGGTRSLYRRLSRLAPRAPRRGQSVQRSGDAAVLGKRFEVQRHSARPARVAAERYARHVDWDAFATEIVERHTDHGRPRTRQKGVYRAAQFGAVRYPPTARQHARATQRAQQRAALALSFCLRLGQGAVGGQYSETPPQQQIATIPEARQRRQIVRVGADEGATRVLARSAKDAPLRALEVEHAGGKQAPLRQQARQARRHGAEILTDDERAGALALQREDAEQILGREAHIGAACRARSGGNPVLPKQAEHMVD